MYEPREDSFLLLQQIKSNVKPWHKVLDIGTGSGILAQEVSKYTKQVIASDINKEIPENLGSIKFIHSNLFSNINERFDLILFNPPYLPSKKIKDTEIEGGKNGTEVIEKFLKQAKKHLNKNGKILLLCSSLNKNIESLFKKYKYNYKKIDETNLFFERLYIYELK
ncbi:MAG: methyltransferase [Candidatus Pacearchaeota archaeon]|nr:methyltransferase [Candidatus Pacearchaeota archaeon]